MHDKTPKLWNRGYARSSLMGYEPTMNPSPAAAFLLGMTVRRPTVHKLGIARTMIERRHRKKTRTGNPLPAALAVLGGLGGLGKRFRESSDKRAAKIAPAIVAIANGGNLNAAKALIDRSNHPMNSKEHAVWERAQAQLAPQIMQAVGKYIDQLGQADMTNPENFAASVAALPVITLQQLQQQEKDERAAATGAAERRAARAEAKQATREAQLTQLGAAGLQALAGRSRRPAQRRRKKRRRSSTQGREFSF